MSKKKVVVKMSDDGEIRIEDQPTMLAKSVVYGAQLLEENDRLKERVAQLEERLNGNRLALDNAIRDGKHHLARNSEMEYWKARRRRIIGAWHLTVKVDLTPWSWRWKPKWFHSSGVWEAAFLFLAVEALEA